MSSLYERILGASFQNLSPVLKRIHDSRARKRYVGRCTIERGKGWLAHAVARIARLPDSNDDAPVEVTIDCSGAGEIWARRFGAHPMISVLRDRCHMLEERLGAVTLRFELVASSDKIEWLLRGARFLLFPLPASWFAACTAYETTDGTQYRFDVHAEMRGVGLLVRYRGWMVEHEGRIE